MTKKMTTDVADQVHIKYYSREIGSQGKYSETGRELHTILAAYPHVGQMGPLCHSRRFSATHFIKEWGAREIEVKESIPQVGGN